MSSSDDKRLERIELKIDRLEVKMDDTADSQAHMNVVLGVQQQILEEHQRRSAANEEAVRILAAELKPVLLYSEIIKVVLRTSIVLIGSAEGIHILYSYLK